MPIFMKPIQIPAEGGKKLNVLGIPMVIRIHGRDTGGVVSAVESHDVPGGGPPPHIHHREDETFQILEGEYEWTVGGKTFIAQKGTTIFAPREIPHTYRYLGRPPGRLMCIITPSGFEGFFEEIGALSPQQQQDIPARDGDREEKPARVSAAARHVSANPGRNRVAASAGRTLRSTAVVMLCPPWPMALTKSTHWAPVQRWTI